MNRALMVPLTNVSYERENCISMKTPVEGLTLPRISLKGLLNPRCSYINSGFSYKFLISLFRMFVY